MKRAGENEAGFTLLEVLVAVGLASLLAVAMAGIGRLATMSWQRSIARSTETEALARLDRTLRRQLAASVPAGALADFAGRPPLFFGAADGFGWVARTPSAAAGAGLFGQRVRVDARDGLVLESWPLDDPAAVERAPLTATKDVRFAYWGKLAPQMSAAWHDRWPAGPIPPDLVRIRLPREAGISELVYPTG